MHGFPITTGQVATFLGTTEPRLGELVRRGRVDPPHITSGRRLWEAHHVLQAARALGVPMERLEGALAAELPEAEPREATR